MGWVGGKEQKGGGVVVVAAVAARVLGDGTHTACPTQLPQQTCFEAMGSTSVSAAACVFFSSFCCSLAFQERYCKTCLLGCALGRIGKVFVGFQLGVFSWLLNIYIYIFCSNRDRERGKAKQTKRSKRISKCICFVLMGPSSALMIQSARLKSWQRPAATTSFFSE